MFDARTMKVGGHILGFEWFGVIKENVIDDYITIQYTDNYCEWKRGNFREVTYKYDENYHNINIYELFGLYFNWNEVVEHLNYEKDHLL